MKMAETKITTIAVFISNYKNVDPVGKLNKREHTVGTYKDR